MNRINQIEEKGSPIKYGQNSNNSIPSMLKQKLKSNQKIDISQIKQYYDIQSHNISYQYTPSNPIGPKQLNNQAQKPECNQSESFQSPTKTELSETPSILQKSKRVVFNEPHVSQIVQIDQQQINYLKRNIINEDSETPQTKKNAIEDFDIKQIRFDDEPIKIEAISQSVTPVKIQRNMNISANKEEFSYKKTGNVSRMSINQSLCDEQILEEIRNWEKMFEVDKTVLGKVETTFKEMEDRISNLEAQFEICYHLTGKIEQKYSDLHKLLKGTPVYKVSRRNKKKANLRIFFYSPSLEAFCWKAPKDHFPEKKQLVYLKNIKEVRTRLEPGRKLPSNLSEDQYIRIIMMDSNQQDLELICEDVSLRASLLKVINSLIEDIRKSRTIAINSNARGDTPSILQVGGGAMNCEFLITKYQNDIQNMKDQMMNTKNFFSDSTQLLRKAFFEATSNLVQKERKKRKQLVIQQKQELILKKEEENEQKNQNLSSIQIQKEDYDSLAYQNLQLKDEISNLHYENQQLSQQTIQDKSALQNLLNNISESINKLCQVPAVQDLQQNFNQLDMLSIREHNSVEYIQAQYQGVQSKQEYNVYEDLQNQQLNQEQYSQIQYQNYQNVSEYNSNYNNYLQILQLTTFLQNCIDKLVYEYFTLYENTSIYERNTTSTNDKVNSTQKDQIILRRTLIDKDDEIKKLKFQCNQLNDKQQTLINEFNKIQNENKSLVDKQQELQRQYKYAEIENMEIKQENLTLQQQIEELLNEISSKEENFTCIVEGLQLMRDKILDQIDILQDELKNQQHQIEQYQQQQQGVLKLNYLENTLKQKEIQIREFIQMMDKNENFLNESQSEINSKSNQIQSFKVSNQLLNQEISNLKCQLNSLNNKNQYLEKLTISLQQQQQQYQNNPQQYSNKENFHPNVLSSDLSFKVKHNRTPSQNSLQFQSKQFNLLNQRNIELQQQLEASSSLVKELEQKIQWRDSLQTSKKVSNESRIQTNPDSSFNSQKMHNIKSQYDASSLKFFHHQHTQSAKIINTDFLNQGYSNQSINNKNI